VKGLPTIIRVVAIGGSILLVGLSFWPCALSNLLFPPCGLLLVPLFPLSWIACLVLLILFIRMVVKRRKTSVRVVLRLGLASLLTALFIAFVIHNLIYPNRVLIRNSSGARVQDVKLILRAKSGNWTMARRITKLSPGETVAFRHGENDTSAALEFRVGDTVHEYEEAYIDLWTGEGWVFDIQSDRTVKGFYDHQLHD